MMRMMTTLLMASVLSTPVMAADIEDQITFRKGYWQVVKHEFGDVIAAMVREKRPMDADRMAEAAARVALLAPLAGEVFPEGSISDDSRALAKIWQDEAGFAKALSTYEDKAVALNAAVASKDRAAIGQAVKEMGGTCKSCHDNYRAE
jgi:cytochrome c556